MRQPKDQSLLFLHAINTAGRSVYNIDWLYMAVFSKKPQFCVRVSNKNKIKIEKQKKKKKKKNTDSQSVRLTIVKLC